MNNNVEYMTLGETLIHDLQTALVFVSKFLFFCVCFVFTASWTIFKVVYCILLLLAVRDGVQWFFGTGRRNYAR